MIQILQRDTDMTQQILTIVGESRIPLIIKQKCVNNYNMTLIFGIRFFGY